MSEKAPKVESKTSQESYDVKEQYKAAAEELNKKQEKVDKDIEAKAKAEVEKQAKSKEEVEIPKAEKKSDEIQANKSYRSVMHRVESKLPTTQRWFSKVINYGPIERVSTIASKTIARPSGILGGGIVALIGLIILAYFSNSIGFSLSGSEFIFLILAGWLVGLIVEGIYKAIR